MVTGLAVRADGGRQVLTTGQVARVCRVAPRTVGKWIDSGELKGYRLPGSGRDRRVTRQDFAEFLRRNGLPFHVPGAYVLAVGFDAAAAAGLRAGLGGLAVRTAASTFAAGAAAAAEPPECVVIDLAAVGRVEGAVIAAEARKADPGVSVLAVGGECPGCLGVTGDLAAAVREAVDGRGR